MVPSKPTQTYVPRVYGFRVNEESPYFQSREIEEEEEEPQIAANQRQLERRIRRQGR